MTKVTKSYLTRVLEVLYVKHVLFNPKYFIHLNNNLGASWILKSN